MKHRIIKLTVAFTLLFSLQGFSQTTEPSKHPLLDKYYPQLKDTDTSKAVTTQSNAIPETRPQPVITKAAEPVVVLPAAPVAATEAPVITTTTVPAIATNNAPPITTTATPAPAINKPAVVATPAPVKNVVAQPAAPLYNPNRLGSSTKQYDTWEKNNNGAGSVTTGNK